MPTKQTVDKAKKDLSAGKAPSTAAGEFVREEMDHIREGKHGARSAKQAIAIGLSKARRAGVPLAAPKPGRTSMRTRQSAARDYATGQGRRKPRAPSAKRGRAVEAALQREPHAAASHQALARQARAAAGQRTATERSAAAKKAVATKGSGGKGAHRPRASKVARGRARITARAPSRRARHTRRRPS
ncbi:MAG TPA: DNA-binding protein [Polyangia bacterium]|nr:DNA-binding protein [Polyangia bacterium]